MTGFEKLFFLFKYPPFVKFLIIVLTILVNALLVEKPSPGLFGFLKDMGRQAIFVLLVLLVFSPALTPGLVEILRTCEFLHYASVEALNQLSFGLILLCSRSLLIRAKILINKFDNKKT